MTQELFVKNMLADLPTIDGHQVTEIELREINRLTTPYFIGMGPPGMLLRYSGAGARRREARRRAQQIMPDVLEQLKPAVKQGEPQVVGFFLTAFFLSYILPSLITWIIERLLLWAWNNSWNEVSSMAVPVATSRKD